MNRLVAQVRSLASLAPPELIQTMFQDGTDGGRVVALALMEADPDPRYFDHVLNAIGASRSAFEQFHGLRVMRDMFSRLDESQKTRLLDVLEAERRDERGTNVQVDSSRWELITDMYRELLPSTGRSRVALGQLERAVVSTLNQLGIEPVAPPRGTNTHPDFLFRIDGKSVVLGLFVPGTREWRRRAREARQQLRQAQELQANAAFLVLPSESRPHTRLMVDRDLKIVTIDDLAKELERLRVSD